MRTLRAAVDRGIIVDGWKSDQPTATNIRFSNTVITNILTLKKPILFI
jgi:hypothetical protein